MLEKALIQATPKIFSNMENNDVQKNSSRKEWNLFKDQNKWYCSYKFPLLPIITIREKDNYNTKHFSFHWLFIKVWTIDTFSFEFCFAMTSHWGIGFIGLLPYLRWAVAIPIPFKISEFIGRKLNRHSDEMKNFYYENKNK
jgi:hypothetical protein